MAARPDGLPHATTVGEAYLSAILDEIRGLRSELSASDEEVTGTPEVIQIKEPATFNNKKRR